MTYEEEQAALATAIAAAAELIEKVEATIAKNEEKKDV
jgi:hypothetical protein